MKLFTAKMSFLFTLLGLIMMTSGVNAGQQNTLAEIWLAAQYQAEAQPVKEIMKTANVDRVTVQFFKVGIPAGILAVGKNTPADGARKAIEIAMKYNRKKIEFLIPEVLLPENYLAVGTSAYDESALIPVRPEDVALLTDPSLTTEQFHAVYLKLTRGDQPFQKDYTRRFNNPR